jgi:hypothetical protein
VLDLVGGVGEVQLMDLAPLEVGCMFGELAESLRELAVVGRLDGALRRVPLGDLGVLGRREHSGRIVDWDERAEVGRIGDVGVRGEPSAPPPTIRAAHPPIRVLKHFKLLYVGCVTIPAALAVVEGSDVRWQIRVDATRGTRGLAQRGVEFDEERDRLGAEILVRAADAADHDLDAVGARQLVGGDARVGELFGEPGFREVHLVR